MSVARTRLFSDNDNDMIMLLVDNVFPLLGGDRHVLWLRNCISAHHNWYSFFTSDNVAKRNLHKYHNYLIKLVGRKRALLDVVRANDTDYLLGRKRDSNDLRYVKYRFDGGHPGVVDGAALPYIVHNSRQLTVLFNSTDPSLKAHFYFVTGMLYTQLQQSVTFYAFVDMVINVITADP